jgi:hypothetical protein
MRRLLTCTALLLALLAAPALAARSYRVDVPRTLAGPLASVKRQTTIPVLLPSRYIAERKRLYGFGSGEADGYGFSLATLRRCGGANACTVAYFTAERGATPTFRTEIPLANGLTGHYKGLSCGASCAPPLIEWVQDGVLYTIQADAGTKRTERRRIVALANSAIRNGPR